MRRTAVPGPVGRLGVICRSFPDNTLGSAATDLLALLPEVVRLGTRVSVVSESPTGRTHDLVWRGVDLHRLALPHAHGLPAYAEAGRWAQAASEWFARQAAPAGITIVEAPEDGAQGLHLARTRDVVLVGRLSPAPAPPSWRDASDGEVLALMEEEARTASVLRAGTTPEPHGGAVITPFRRLSVRRRPSAGGPVVLVAPPGAEVAGLVRAVAEAVPHLPVAVCGCDPARDAAAVEALTALVRDGLRVVVVADRSVAGLCAWMEDASAAVLARGCDTGIAVDALAHGIPVVTDATVDPGMLGGPEGLSVVAAGDVAGAVAHAVGDAALRARVAAGAPEFAARWGPASAARHLLDRYARIEGRRAHSAGRAWAAVASPRFAAPGAARVGIAIDGDAPGAAALLGRLRLTAGSDAAVLVVGGDGLDDLPAGARRVPGPARGTAALAAAAAGLGARIVVAAESDVQLDPGWAARLEALAARFGRVGVLGPGASGYRVRRRPEGLVLEAVRPGLRPCDVVLSPVLCTAPDLVDPDEPEDAVEAALRRALRARAAGARVLQIGDVGLRAASGSDRPDRIVIPEGLVAALAAEGLDPDGWIVDLVTSEGFHATEEHEGAPFSWMGAAGVLAGDVPSAGRWELTMTCRAFLRPRAVALVSAAGDRADLGVVAPDGPTDIRSVLSLGPGPVALRLEVSDPPDRPCDVMSSPDDRPLSVSVAAPLLERVG